MTKAENWAKKLNAEQKQKALELAERIERRGFDTSMFEEFKSINIRSFNMEAFLRIGQFSQERHDRVRKQTVEMLRVVENF